MKKIFASIFVILLGVTLSCGGIFLLSGCNSNPESSESGGVVVPPDPETPEIPEPDEGSGEDDNETTANADIEVTVTTAYRTSSTSVSLNSHKGYFNVHLKNNTVGGWVNWGNANVPSTTTCSGMTKGGGAGNQTWVSNIIYFRYFWNANSAKRMILVESYSTDSASVAFSGVDSSYENSKCRGESLDAHYIYNTNKIVTHHNESIANSGCTTKIWGNFFSVFRARYWAIYNLNGGTGFSDNQSFLAGLNYRIRPDIPTKGGYTFAGWKLNNVVYQPNQLFGDDWSNGNKTFTAQWTPNTYMVDINILSPTGVQDNVSGTVTATYSSDGATYTNITDQVRETVPYNTTITISNIKPATGMSLSGVTCNKGKITASGGTYTYTASMTGAPSGTWDDEINIRMRWASYTVSFNSNGGTSVSSKTVTYKSTYGTLSTPTRTGYNFGGWYKEQSLTNAVSSSTVVTTAGNHTLYAKWSPKMFTVTFNANGGSTSVSSKQVTYDSAYGALPTPTRTGDHATFKGWTLNGNLVTASTTVKTAENHTLVAAWLPSLVTININIKTSEDGISYANSVVGREKVVVKYKTYSNVVEIENSVSIEKDAVTSISNVVLFSTLTIETTSNIGYVYVGTSYESTPPASSTLPSSVDTFQLSSRAAVNIFFKKTAKNILKFEKTSEIALITNDKVISPTVNSLKSKEISMTSSGDFVMDSDGYYVAQKPNAKCKVNVTAFKDFLFLNYMMVKSVVAAGYAYFGKIDQEVSTTNYLFRREPDFGLRFFYVTPHRPFYFYVMSTDVGFKFKLPYSEYTVDGSSGGGTDPGPPIKTENYGFALNSQGYYESQNKGIANSYALCRMSFTVKKQTQLVFTVAQNSESANDFGIFGRLNQSLSRSMDIDSSYYKSFQNYGTASNTVTYSVSPGTHFIEIKYRKNSTIDQGADFLMFRYEIPKQDVGYFYFEDGDYPQTYVGDQLNAELDKKFTATDPDYYLNYSDGVSKTQKKIPVFSDDSEKYAALICGKTMSLNLGGKTYNFEKNKGYYFKVEKIRWRVSDYGVLSTDYPSGWEIYGAYNTNFTVVSDKVLGFGAVTRLKTKECWSWTESELYTNTLDYTSNNQSKNKLNLEHHQTDDIQVPFDKFGAKGQQNKVESVNSDSYMGVRVASVEDVKTNLTDLRAKASDMVKFLLGLSSEWADYWTRDLGNNLDNGIVVTKSGIEKSTWLNQMKGVRFAMTMKDGTRL